MLPFAQSAFRDILTWLPVMTVIITVHELGHFLVARFFGVAVDRFSIGFGRAIYSRRDRHGTEWRVSWIPIGGYVRFAGDENAASVPDLNDLEELRAHIVAHEGVGAEKKYFAFKPLWQRACVVAAGPFANFLLAIVLFAGLSMTLGENVAISRISTVEAGSPAAQAGLQPGDTILKLDGHPITQWDELSRYVVTRTGVPIVMSVKRGPALLTLTATPIAHYFDDPIKGGRNGGALGVQSGPLSFVHEPRNPAQAVVSGVRQTWDILDTTVIYIGRMLHGQVSANQIGGPIGIAQLTGAVAKAGAHDAPDFAAATRGVVVGLVWVGGLISVSVGFINLLPIPVLDGGHLLFYAYEAAARRPLAASVQMVSYRVGLALMLGLMLFATTNDLRRTNIFHFLGGLFS
jgi:regulator of sigma E protease